MDNSSDNVFDPVEEAIQDIAEGKLVIVTDDETRENEGDLIMAASKVTPEAINLMIRYCSGIICAPTTSHQLKHLGINQMVPDNRESYRTDFTISVDAAEGISTGISAFDRATTIKILSDPESHPENLVQPGHVFPLRARPGGVLQRAGHTEAAVDLAVLAGLHPSGVLCELLNDDGSCARLPALIEFKKKLGLKLISIADLIQYRHKREKLVERLTQQPFASAYGKFDLHVYRNKIDGRHHIALSVGKLSPEPTLVRVHSENLLSDIFQARDMNSHQSLVSSLEWIAKEKNGVILYLEQPHSGFNVENSGKEKNGKIAPARMDFRDYGIGAQILSELGLKKIRLLSSTRRKVIALDGYDLEIVEQISLT